MTQRGFAIILSVIVVAAFAACDFRSETAKREMEKFTSSPTPTITPTPTPVSIDPSEVLNADIGLQGDLIQLNKGEGKKTGACTKYNRVMVNGDGGIVTVTGACKQIMVNGNRNQVTAQAASEFVINGTENSIKYSHYVNSRHPQVTDNKAGNTIEKITASPAKR